MAGPAGWIALALLIACGAGETRRPQQHRSRAARYEHESSAAFVDTASAAAPPRCAAPSARAGSDLTAASPDWSYRTFLERVRQQLIMHWSPAMLLATIDPTGRRYGPRHRNAEIRACLSRTGQLAGLTITTSSGVPELDDAMIRAFQAAAPFLNPPEALAQGDDQVRFGFSFMFYPTPPGKGPVMSIDPSRSHTP
jgi:TonB family protein